MGWNKINKIGQMWSRKESCVDDIQYLNQMRLDELQKVLMKRSTWPINIDRSYWPTLLRPKLVDKEPRLRPIELIIFEWSIAKLELRYDGLEISNVWKLSARVEQKIRFHLSKKLRSLVNQSFQSKFQISKSRKAAFHLKHGMTSEQTV